MTNSRLQKNRSPWWNGAHGITTLIALIVLLFAAPARTVAQTMTVGSPALLYTNYSTGTTSDLSCPVVKDPANPNEVFSWTSNGQFAFAKFRGPLNDPQRTQLWSGYSGRWNFTGFPSGYRPWLGNIYKHTDGTLIGFVHIETAVYDDPNCQYRQGIAISTDNGDHWRYCGDVIKSQVDVVGQQENLGGCAVVKVGNYFYQYFNEYETGYFRKPAVARALIADVVAAAKNNTVSPWFKYYNGQWNRNALTEAGSSVLPYPTDRYDAHGDAVYCKALGKYLMVVYEQTGYDYTPPYPISNARKGIYMYSSTDGVNWGDKRHVFVPQTGGDGCYPFFGGITDASDDNLEVGGDFYLYVHDRARHELYRIPITVGTPASTGRRILQIGDSNTEIGYITNGLRTEVIADYGDQGSGYYPLNAAKTGAAYGTLPAGFTVTNDASWQQIDMYASTRRTPPHNAPDGNWIESSTVNATTTVQFNGTGVDIYWLARSSGGSFSVTVDGVLNSTVSTSDTATSTKRTRISGLASGNHTILLKVVSGNVALLGVDAKKGIATDAERSVVHKFGNGSASTQDYLAIDTGVFQSALALLNPTDVCVVLGTNDHNIDNRSVSAFQTNLTTLVNRIKTALPSAKVWVVSTFETDTVQGKTTLLPGYVATSFPGAATATSSSYWNMYGWFGPYNASRMLDAYHCNSTSGASIGQEQYRVITDTVAPPQIAAPSFSPAGGTYATGQTVTMTTATSGASIYYTTNGNTPTTGSLLYTSPVSVTSTSTLKAIAYRSDLGSSSVTTGNYYIGIGPELLNNTGFETDLGGWSSNGPAISRVTTQFNSGIAACRSGSRTANWNGPAQTIKTALTSNGPGNYTVSAYMKLASGSDLGQIQIGLTAGGTTTYPTVTGSINSSGWALVTGTVNLSWSGTLDDAKFYINTGTSLAEMYVDDCSLRKGSAVPLVVEVPTFNPPAGTYSTAQAVTISSATPGATIRYTVDGTAPTATNGSTYSTPVNIAANTTLRAYALKSGMTDSAGATAVYAVRVADPAFSPAAGTYNAAQAVAMTTATPGATIRYTVDGTEPTPTNGSIYSTPVNIAANTTLKAYALKSGMADSTGVTGSYVITYPSEVVNGGYENGSEGWTVASSDANSAAYGVTNTQGAWEGTYALGLGGGNAAGNAILTQTLSTIPGGAYSLGFQYGAFGYAGKQQRLLVEVLDGTTVLASQVVTATGPGNLDPAQTTFQPRSLGFTAGSSTIVIRFTDQTTLANSNSCDGMLDAVVLSPVLVAVEAPGFNPPGGTYSSAQAVTISTATSGATIRYTTDGTAPTATNGSTYSAPVNIAANATLRAYAYKSGMADSAETSGDYVINVAPPANGISNGSFENSTTGWEVNSSNGGAVACAALNNQGTRDGSYALALGNGNAAGNAILSQSFTTTPGAPYTLGFQYGAFGYAGKQQRLLVEVLDGTTVLVSQVVTAYGPGNLDPAQTTFQLQSFGFTAGSSTTIVRFTDQTTLANSNACDGMLDAVGVTPVAGALPDPWVGGDVGTVGVTGSASEAWGVYTVAGSGADIWGTADAFQFVQQAASGDCEITAKVTAVGNTNPWAKAGVMIRETLNDNSAYAMAVITPSNGACLMYRTTTGGTCGSTQSTGKAAPYWVRVKRVGNSFSSYMSPNGTTWTQIGTAKTIAMGSTAYIGLCLTSHDNAVLGTATFENVSVAP